MTYNIHVGAGMDKQLETTRNLKTNVRQNSRTKGEGFSYPADKPAKRIDHIFYGAADSMRAKRAWVVDTLASDHVPVVAELDLR